MKKLFVAEAPKTTRKSQKPRLVEAPPKITGLYRLSVRAKKPFVVDIGKRKIDGVRSLEVFHGVPMYMDSLKHIGPMKIWGPIESPTKFEMHLESRRTAAFRITADEVLPEQIQIGEQIEIASLNAKMPYRGFYYHIRTMREERNPKLAYHYLSPESAWAEALSESFSAGMAGVWSAALVLAAITVSMGIMAVVVPVATDPWRTYINGRLCKNLKEVKVQLRDADVTGFFTP
jgi:hypothetical protein